jgi:hypothetical protein
VKAVLVGAVLGLLWRLILLFPADFYARWLGDPGADPSPGTLAAWLHAPAPGGNFLRLFVLSTWWFGALAGAILSARKGGGGLDITCGLIAGAVAGLAGAATVGCLLVAGDEVPRILMAPMASSGMGSAAATMTWAFIAVLSWAGLGAAAGLVLMLLGELGQGLLAAIGGPFAWALRLGGLESAARMFEPG